jgi:4-carboxymuconolactone decarboxylase
MSKPENLYASSPDDELHIQHYLSTNCFGDHYTWTGIDVPTREMLTFGARRARGCEPQVWGQVAANRWRRPRAAHRCFDPAPAV